MSVLEYLKCATCILCWQDAVDLEESWDFCPPWEHNLPYWLFRKPYRATIILYLVSRDTHAFSPLSVSVLLLPLQGWNINWQSWQQYTYPVANTSLKKEMLHFVFRAQLSQFIFCRGKNKNHMHSYFNDSILVSHKWWLGDSKGIYSKPQKLTEISRSLVLCYF